MPLWGKADWQLGKCILKFPFYLFFKFQCLDYIYWKLREGGKNQVICPKLSSIVTFYNTQIDFPIPTVCLSRCSSNTLVPPAGGCSSISNFFSTLAQNSLHSRVQDLSFCTRVPGPSCDGCILSQYNNIILKNCF